MPLLWLIRGTMKIANFRSDGFTYVSIREVNTKRTYSLYFCILKEYAVVEFWNCHPMINEIVKKIFDCEVILRTVGNSQIVTIPFKKEHEKYWNAFIMGVPASKIIKRYKEREYDRTEKNSGTAGHFNRGGK